MDTYSIWLDSAMVYMKRNRKRVVLPKALTVKMIPQFADMPTTIEDNLFYSSIKLMPSTFLKKQKGLTENILQQSMIN
jgi:hypothetical protein